MMVNKRMKVIMKITRRMFLLGFCSFAVIITITLMIGKYWIDIFDKYKEKRELEEKLVELQTREKELKLDANKLQDPDYIARYAREKYSYSKDGEFIIKIPEK